jgi:HEAT repeat protein
VPVAGRIGRDTGWLDRPRRLRREAVRTLASVGTPEAIDELEDLVSIRAPLAPWRSARVQRAAFEAICGLEAPAAEKALERISARGPRWLRGVARRLVAGGMGHDRRGAAVELTAEGAETTP